MTCERCKGTGTDPRTSTTRGVDACPLCAKLAEAEYQAVQQKLREAA